MNKSSDFLGFMKFGSFVYTFSLSPLNTADAKPATSSTVSNVILMAANREFLG